MYKKRRILLYVAGLFVMAFGIVLIKKAGVGVSPVSSIPSVLADLMLPSPDALIRAISLRFARPLSRVKIIWDSIYVAIALILELVFFRHPESVWFGTLLSVILTGRLVGVFSGWMSKNQTGS